MRRATFLLPLGCLFFALACSKEQRATAIIPSDDANPGDVPGYDVYYDTGVRPDGDSSGGDGTSTDGTTEGGDAPTTAMCPKGYVDVKPTAVTYPGMGKGEQIAAITWDELTMAWTTGDSTSGYTVHYSDRSGRDAAFTTDNTLPTTLGPFGQDKVGLYADGLTLIYVSADHKKLGQLTRGSRGSTFDASTLTTAPFSLLTTAGEGGSTRTMTDLVLSKDGKWLFFTDLDRKAGTTMMVSVKMSDGKWDMPSAVESTHFALTGGARRRPTGYSADRRTLFYYDEVSETANVAFSDPGSALFTEFYAFVPTGTGAMPNDGCDRVYLSVVSLPTGDAGPDVKPTPNPPAIFWAP